MSADEYNIAGNAVSEWRGFEDDRSKCPYKPQQLTTFTSKVDPISGAAKRMKSVGRLHIVLAYGPKWEHHTPHSAGLQTAVPV